MCLRIDDKLTKRLKRRKRRFGAWKIYHPFGYGLSSVVRNASIYEHGAVLAKKRGREVGVKLTNREMKSGSIDYGIHVYLNEGEANYLGRFPRKVVKVIVDPKDLRAAGHDQAVFTRVFISKAEFDKATGRKP